MTDLTQAERDKLNRASYAKSVLENPIYQEAIMMIKATYVEKMGKTDTKDIAELQEISRSLKNLDRIERLIRSTMEHGKVIEDKQRKLFGLRKAS